MVITFASQKGGVGKSTLLLSIATALHYNFKKTVRVIDSDIPQNSIFELREFENKKLRESIEAWKKKEPTPFFFPKIIKEKRKMYPIQVLDLLEINHQGKFKEDLVLIDTLGTLNSQGYDELFNFTDYFIVPMSVDFFDFKATMEYVKLLEEAKREGLIKGYFILLNKVNLRAIGDAQDIIKILERKEIPHLTNLIPLGEAYKREPMSNEKYYKTGVRSTMIATSNVYINKVTEEILSKIQ